MNIKKEKYISQFLINSIIKCIEKHNNNESVTKIEAENIKEYLNFGNSNNINDLIIELAENKRSYVASLLDFLLKIITDENKKELLKSIEVDADICYLEDDLIKDTKNLYNSLSEGNQISYAGDLIEIGSEKYDKGDKTEAKQYSDRLIIIEGKNYGNIYYYDSTSEKEIIKNKNNLGNLKVQYLPDTCVLKYNGKFSNFSGGNIQNIFIKEIFKNINTPITRQDLRDKGVNDPEETLKNVRKKLESEIGENQFTGLETRTLLSDFTFDKTKYFIMHG